MEIIKDQAFGLYGRPGAFLFFFMFFLVKNATGQGENALWFIGQARVCAGRQVVADKGEIHGG